MGPFYRYLSEVKKKDISKIGSRVNSFIKKETGEPFNDIFHGDARILVPIASEEQISFEDFLKSIGLSNVDLKKGTAERTIATQKGPKQQEVRIGKFIQGHKDKATKSNEEEDAEEADKNLKWWEKNKDKIGNVGDTGVSVIISRHPIDILRMSDHKEWSSCHSPGNSYYKCAIQEARNGGAVAYVVRNSDLATIKNLQAKEIFKDSDRNVKGVEPIERVRLRRFTDDKTEYLVPELRTYGTKHVGLYQTVKNWAYNAQRERLKDPDFNDMKLAGGSYMDNDASDIWSSFLDRDVDVEVEKEEGKEDGIDEERVRELIRGHPYKHFYVDGNVEDMDGGDYVYYSGSVQFEFDKKRMTSIPKEGKGGGAWELKNAIRQADLSIYTIENIEFEVREDKFYIQMDIRHEEGNGTLDSLEHFLDDVDTYDKNYDESRSALEHLLWSQGYYTIPLEGMEFENLEFEGYEEGSSKPEYKFTAFSIDVGSLKGLNPHIFPVGKQGKEVYDLNSKGWRKDLTNIYTSLVTQMFKEGETDHASKLDIHVKVTASGEVEGIESYDPIKAASEEVNKVYKSGHVTAYITITVNDSDDETVRQLENFDNKYPEVEAFLNKEWYGMVSQYKKEIASSEGEHTPKYVASTIESKFKYFGMPEDGKVYAKNGQYWYKDSNSDQPAGPLLSKLSTIAPKFSKLSQDLSWWTKSYEIVKPYAGNFFFKIVNENPVAMWKLKSNGEELPFAQVYKTCSKAIDDARKNQE